MLLLTLDDACDPGPPAGPQAAQSPRIAAATHRGSKNMDMTHARAIALMVLVTLMWSTAGVVTRHLASASGFEVTFWRSFFAALTVLAWLVWQRARGPAQGQTRHIGSGLAHPAIWISGVMWATMFTCFTVALAFASVAHVLIVQCLAPVFTAMLARLVFARALGARTGLAIGLAAFGICTMYVFDITALDSRHAWGLLIALGIPVAAAINWVVVERSGRALDLSGAVLVGGVISATAALPMAWPLDTPAGDILMLALLGIFQLGVPCVLAMHVMRHIDATEVSLLVLLEVVFGILLTWLFARETHGWATWLGGAIVLAALVYNETGRSRTPRVASANPAGT
jgi:drug/metabolite transporter (DMT)-like permease